MENNFICLGRRKTSIAKVSLSLGKGEIIINGIPIEKYFPNKLIIKDLLQPLELLNAANKFNISAKVSGGGFTGQGGAIRLAISRALVLIDKNNKKILKNKKFLTRDSRMKERKKIGKYGARRSYQFTKR
jgi:small subunit ribosomal protein S9